MNRKKFKAAVVNNYRAMESGYHFKNGARPAKLIEQGKIRSCARHG